MHRNPFILFLIHESVRHRNRLFAFDERDHRNEVNDIMNYGWTVTVSHSVIFDQEIDSLNCYSACVSCHQRTQYTSDKFKQHISCCLEEPKATLWPLVVRHFDATIEFHDVIEYRLWRHMKCVRISHEACTRMESEICIIYTRSDAKKIKINENINYNISFIYRRWCVSSRLNIAEKYIENVKIVGKSANVQKNPISLSPHHVNKIWKCVHVFCSNEPDVLIYNWTRYQSYNKSYMLCRAIFLRSVSFIH